MKMEIIIETFDFISTEIKQKIVDYITSQCSEWRRRVYVKKLKDGLLEISDGHKKHLVYPHEL
jgi:transposase-like protein